LSLGKGSTLTVSSFTQAASGTLASDIAGLTPGTEFGDLSTGTASLAGTLVATVIDGFDPADQVKFGIISGTDIAGDFSTLIGSGLAPDKSFSKSLSKTQVLLTVNAVVTPNGIWDGGGDQTSWEDARNWSNNTLPGPADEVIIQAAAGAVINHGGGDDIVAKLTSFNPLTISGGSLIVSGDAKVPSLTASGGAGTFNGAFDGGSTLVVSGGAVTFNGPTTFTSPSSLTVSSGSATFNVSAVFATATLSGGTLAGSGDITFTQSLSWSGSGGTMNGSGKTIVNAGATFALTGNSMLLDRVL
jgi:hypothetical protein